MVDRIRPCRARLLPIAACLFAAAAARAQAPYRNVVNTRFHAVGNGPQSSLIVDVPAGTDRAVAHATAVKSYRALVQATSPAILREIALLRRRRLLRPSQQFDLTTSAIIRPGGALPTIGRGTPTRAPGLNIVIPTSGANSWSVAAAQQLQQIVNILVPELQKVLGAPYAGANWNQTVTIYSLDPDINNNGAVYGALLVLDNSNPQQPVVSVDFPSFSAFETQFLAMAQVLAQAWQGPALMGYDAWSKGMARAVAVVAAVDLQSTITNLGQSVDPGNLFYYTPFYDLLNEPALGNNSFLPPTPAAAPLNNSTLAAMLVPRLEMASTAWLKCYIENPNFFSQFFAQYFTEFNSDPTAADDTGRLTTYAAQADPTVETLPFAQWLEQQYALDTSVTAGPKLYIFTTPTPSDTGESGAAFDAIYYETGPTGDEANLNGIANVLYWDYTYTSQLEFGQPYDTIQIQNGFGTVAPIFTSLGTPSTMRLAVDFLISNSYVRVFYPAGEELRSGSSTVFNDFSGVTVGADSGSLVVNFEGASGPIGAQVVQGAFAGNGTPTGFSRTRITFSPPANGTPVNFQRNTLQRSDTASAAFNGSGLTPVWVLTIPGQTVTLTPALAAGPNMISLPLQPYGRDLAAVFGVAAKSALLAQWRQDNPVPPNPDQYLRYPTLPLYQPGYGLWTDFPNSVNTPITGVSTDTQPQISVALQYGWNQIGSPFDTALTVTTALGFSFQGTLGALADAVSNGWVAAGIMAYDPTTNGYDDITQSTNAMNPWQGYWIRVLVTEGVTLTYTNPTSSAASTMAVALRSAARRATVAAPARTDGWRLPLILSDAAGHAARATLGQASTGSDAFVPALDVAVPPAFSRAVPLALGFAHSDWNTGYGKGGGEFLSDVRRANSQATWNLNVHVPDATHSYTVGWSGAAYLPRGTRATLIDTVTGKQTLMNAIAGYSFQPAKGETTRAFQITVEPHSQGGIVISNATIMVPRTAPGRAISSITISYQLSAAATTSVQVLRAGRVVRHLTSGRAQPSGISETLWDTRDDHGIGLPAGAYMVMIGAQTPDGEQVRTVLPLILTR